MISFDVTTRTAYSRHGMQDPTVPERAYELLSEAVKSARLPH